MLTLEQFINENYKGTNSNKERKEELEKWLKNKNYPDYVNTLNKMLDDPKAKTLLQDGFGGKLGNMKFTYSVEEIPANNLVPTQSEIDINKSIKHGLSEINCIVKDFDEPVVITNIPLITFRGNYVIDGHHRWAETMAINPSAKMLCFNYDANISIIAMLKAVQGAIAAVMADNNDNNGHIPTGVVKDQNVFDMSKEELFDYIENNLTNGIVEIIQENVKGLDTKQNVIAYIKNNILDMQANNYPEHGMPNRGEMPQTDKAGAIKGDKPSSFPDKTGSALNKLKTGKVDKDVL